MGTYSYRFFDHTADVGVEAEAGSPAELFAAVAEAVVNLLLERPPRPGDDGASEERTFEATASDLETLLVRWANEILYWVQVDSWVPARSAVALHALRPVTGEDVPDVPKEGAPRERAPQRYVTEGAPAGDVPQNGPEDDPNGGWYLAATCAGVPLDVRAMGFRGEIKAATYHQVAVRQVGPEPGRWQARIILDV